MLEERACGAFVRDGLAVGENWQPDSRVLAWPPMQRIPVSAGVNWVPLAA